MIGPVTCLTNDSRLSFATAGYKVAVRAVPLTGAAALGALAFGHVEFSVTTSIIVGSVPAVLVGSFLSSRAPDQIVRPVITFVIFASGLKYVGVSTTTLGWVLCAAALLVAVVWTAHAAVEKPDQAVNGGSGRWRCFVSRPCSGSSRRATTFAPQ